MLYQNAADETLVMLTLAGEQAAYEVLVTRYQRTVISAAVTVTKSGAVSGLESASAVCSETRESK